MHPEYELEYVTRTMLESRPWNLEGWTVTEPGWYWSDDFGNLEGPFKTAREASEDAEMDWREKVLNGNEQWRKTVTGKQTLEEARARL